VLNDAGWTHLEMTPPSDSLPRQSGLFEEDG